MRKLVVCLHLLAFDAIAKERMLVRFAALLCCQFHVNEVSAAVRQVQVHCLSGHDDTVASILTQATDPQVCIAISIVLQCHCWP